MKGQAACSSLLWEKITRLRNLFLLHRKVLRNILCNKKSPPGCFLWVWWGYVICEHSGLGIDFLRWTVYNNT
ncbi:hypothetical protein DXA13_18255 [Clostridium sp. AM58-1XD]|nr:hypothetical protein DXA13_18255 [Clostridium sp. AM58-1XD]